MTIYSGFATRKLQERYNNLISSVFQLLSQLIITYIERSKIEPFEKHFKRIYLSLQKMDSLKHLDPKFSSVLKPLSDHILFQNEVFLKTSQQIESNPNSLKKRPMTSNTHTPERRLSIDMERKTIGLVPERNRTLMDRYLKIDKNGSKNQSFTSVKILENKLKVGQANDDLNSSMTMEQLMEKNRLVERKLTLFRKKKQMHPQNMRVTKIPELEEEEDTQLF